MNGPRVMCVACGKVEVGVFSPMCGDCSDAVGAPRLRGFGTTFDLQTGAARSWYVGADGIERWADNDQPTTPSEREGRA